MQKKRRNRQSINKKIMSPTLILIILLIFFPALLWKTFEHAGFPGFHSVIPFYNYYIWLKIIGKPLWWYIFLIIPFINAFVVMLMIVETLKCYKIHSLGQQALAVIFPLIYLPWLGIKKAGQLYRTRQMDQIQKNRCARMD